MDRSNTDKKFLVERLTQLRERKLGRIATATAEHDRQRLYGMAEGLLLAITAIASLIDDDDDDDQATFRDDDFDYDMAKEDGRLHGEEWDY